MCSLIRRRDKPAAVVVEHAPRAAWLTAYWRVEVVQRGYNCLLPGGCCAAWLTAYWRVEVVQRGYNCLLPGGCCAVWLTAYWRVEVMQRG